MTSLKDEMLEEAKQDASRMAEHAQAKVSHAASHVQATVSEALAPFSRVEHNFEMAMLKSAREQPMATLAVFAGLGFVLGALWKS